MRNGIVYSQNYGIRLQKNCPFYPISIEKTDRYRGARIYPAGVSGRCALPSALVPVVVPGYGFGKFPGRYFHPPVSCAGGYRRSGNEKKSGLFPGKNCRCPGSVQVISPSMSERSLRISIQMISSFFSLSFTFTFRLMIPVTGDASRETDADE